MLHPQVLVVSLPSIRGLPRAYWALWTGTLVNRMGSFVVPFLMIYLTDERGLSVERASFVVSLYGAGSLGAGLLGGFLSDRIGRRRTMLLGFIAGAAVMSLLAVARDPAVLAVATFALALAGDLSRPPVWAAATDLVPEVDRPRAFGLLYWAINLGFACAPLIAGLLSGRSFTLLFVGDAATTLACAAIVARWVPETRPEKAAGHGHVTVLESLAPFRDPVFMAFGLSSVLLALVFQQCLSSLPVDMRARGISAAAYGVVLSLNGWLIVVLQPFAVGFVGRFPRHAVLAVAAVLTGVGFAVPAFVTTEVAFACSVLVWTLGEIAMAPVSPVVLASLSPLRLRGSYQGMHQVFWGASSFLAPMVGAWVIERHGAPTLWLASFGVCGVSAVAFLAIAGPARRRAAAIAAEEATVGEVAAG